LSICVVEASNSVVKAMAGMEYGVETPLHQQHVAIPKHIAADPSRVRLVPSHCRLPNVDPTNAAKESPTPRTNIPNRGNSKDDSVVVVVVVEMHSCIHRGMAHPRMRAM
jgi:hypothetical protein